MDDGIADDGRSGSVATAEGLPRCALRLHFAHRGRHLNYCPSSARSHHRQAGQGEAPAFHTCGPRRLGTSARLHRGYANRRRRWHASCHAFLLRLTALPDLPGVSCDMVLPAASSPIRLAEFLQMVTSEANDACNETGKKTITEEHVIAALRKLDFDRFASECAGIGGEEQARVPVDPPVRRPLFWPPPARLASGSQSNVPQHPARASHSSTRAARPCPPGVAGAVAHSPVPGPVQPYSRRRTPRRRCASGRRSASSPGAICAPSGLPCLPAHRRTRRARRAGAKSDDPRL